MIVNWLAYSLEFSLICSKIEFAMRRFVIIISLFLSTLTFGQTASEVFDYKAITFYGLDFTAAKCTGVGEFPAPDELITKYYPEWNNAFMVGKKRIKIGQPYDKSKVQYDTAVYGFNRMTDPAELIIDKPFSLKKSDVKEIVQKYANSGKAGLGLVYVVENLNSKDGYLSVWITFFNIGTGEILISEPSRAKGKAKKFGDIWLNAFLELYINSEKDYKAWKKLYH